MYTARQVVISNQRNSGVSGYNGSRRVLPLSSYSTQVASDSRNAADEAMKRGYADGLVSSQEYIDHLKTMKRRDGIDEIDLVKLDDEIRDVQREVEVSQLQTAYSKAEDGSEAQINLATQIAEYYSEWSRTLSPGTPASNEAMVKSQQWQNEALSIVEMNKKNDRKTERLAELARISALNPSDPDTAYQKAQAYATLRDRANADGAYDEAYQYETKAQNAMNQAEALEQKVVDKAKAEYKTNITTQINQALDDYHDGRMGAGEIMDLLRDAEYAAAELGDTSLSLRINSKMDTINRDVESKQAQAEKSVRSQYLTEMDLVELDIQRLDNALRYGMPFTPESNFFSNNGGEVNLGDVANLKAMGYQYLNEIATEARMQGIDIPESRVYRIEDKLAEAQNHVEAAASGLLTAQIDPGTGELKLIDLDSPEQMRDMIEMNGVSYQLNRRDVNNMEDEMRAVSSGYASPTFYATTGTLGQGGYQLVQNRKFAPDRQLDIDAPLYETEDNGVYAIKGSDLGMDYDPNTFYRVEAVGNELKVSEEQVTPKYDIDPVINVRSPFGGLDSVFVKTDPISGERTYYHERLGRTLTEDEISPILRSKQPIEPGMEGPLAPYQERLPQPDEPGKLASAVQDLQSGVAQPKVEQPQQPQQPKPMTLKESFAEPITFDRLKSNLPTISRKQDYAPTSLPEARLKSAPQYDTKQNIPLMPDRKASELLYPKTVGEKVQSGLMKAGAGIQSGVQKAGQAVGGFFNRLFNR